MRLEAERAFLEELSAERLYLYVPAPESERVKALGAKWDAQVCMWYATASGKPGRFARWRPIWPLDDDPIVQVLGMPSNCWKCRSQTLAVVGCQYDDQVMFAHKGVLQVLASQLSADELHELGAGALRPRYSHATHQSSWSNGCVECDTLLGGLPLSESFWALVSQGQADLPSIGLARVPVEMLRAPGNLG